MRKQTKFLLIALLIIPFLFTSCSSDSGNEVIDTGTGTGSSTGTGNGTGDGTGDGTVDDPDPVTDIDGNVYLTVKIGEQIWMAKDLEVNRFRDGTDIPNITDGTDWSNSATPVRRGKLYNGYTIVNGGLCPDGWHLPTLSEWTTLVETVGGMEVAGGKLKATGSAWSEPNTGATNEFRFSALPGGLIYVDGSLRNAGDIGYWWTAFEGDPNQELVDRVSGLGGVAMAHDSEEINLGSENLIKNGYSCRCVKD